MMKQEMQNMQFAEQQMLLNLKMMQLVVIGLNTALPIIFGVFFSDEKNESIYGIENSIGSNDIVEVATKQLGNKGGEMYWRWYGFNDRVEWCACLYRGVQMNVGT